MNDSAADVLELMTREVFDVIREFVDAMRDDDIHELIDGIRDEYDEMRSDIMKNGYQVKPFDEILKEELGDVIK